MKNGEVLIVIDMQNDFITGALGSNQAQEIVPKVCEKIKNTNADKIFYTIDTHELPFYHDTIEGKEIPDHCLYLSDGWYIEPKAACAFRDVLIDVEEIEKNTFGSIDELPNAIGDFCAGNSCAINDLTIQVIGLCTDICVISNVLILRAAFPHAKIVVDAACCAGSTILKHQMALEIMKSNCIEVINDI